MKEWRDSLKSDTEPATIAFRNCVAENCNTEVALEDAVKGDTQSNGLVGNAVMLLSGVIKTHQVPRGELHTRGTSRRLPDLAVVGGTCRKHFVQVVETVKPAQEFGEKVLARPKSSEPLNRMNPRYKFGVWLEVTNNSAERCVQSASGQEDVTPRLVGQGGNQQSDRSPVKNR